MADTTIETNDSEHQNDHTREGRNGGTLTPWQPGQSGNPEGRKKGRHSLLTMLEHVLDSTIPVPVTMEVDGEQQETHVIISRREAMLLRYVNIALKGDDPVALHAIQGIITNLEGRAPVRTPPPPDQSGNVHIFYVPVGHSRKKKVKE